MKNLLLPLSFALVSCDPQLYDPAAAQETATAPAPKVFGNYDGSPSPGPGYVWGYGTGWIYNPEAAREVEEEETRKAAAARAQEERESEADDFEAFLGSSSAATLGNRREPWVKGGWPDSKRPGDNPVGGRYDKYFKLVDGPTNEHIVRKHPLGIAKPVSGKPGYVLTPWGNEVDVDGIPGDRLLIDPNFPRSEDRAEDREFYLP